jgi:Phosphotransferase enzyme family
VTAAMPQLAATDAALPHLADALSPDAATAAVATAKHFASARVRVTRAALLRHKPGRRAVIDYTIDVTWPDGRAEEVAAVGKMRASRPPRTAYRLLRELWRHGFTSDSADGISVPEPLGTVPALGLWLQRRVPGTLATTLLTTTAAVPLARRIAEAALKLHHAGVVPEKVHGPNEELAILERVLDGVRSTRSEMRGAIDHLLACGRRLVATLDGPATGIHRDFYADQIVVDGRRLYLLDFDLYCVGHAALDVGNFAGHLLEQRLREPEHAPALACAQDALETHYMRLAGDAARHPLRVYTALTLARHVYLSTVIPGRATTTGAVLDQTLTCMEALLDGRA